MARYADAHFMDGLLERLEGMTTLTVTAGEPTDIADIAARALASTTIDAADWTLSDDGAGRRSDINQQEDLDITDSGEADHVVIDDGTYYYATVCDPQQLTEGGTVTVGTWGVSVGAPTAP